MPASPLAAVPTILIDFTPNAPTVPTLSSFDIDSAALDRLAQTAVIKGLRGAVPAAVAMSVVMLRLVGAVGAGAGHSWP